MDDSEHSHMSHYKRSAHIQSWEKESALFFNSMCFIKQITLDVNEKDNVSMGSHFPKKKKNQLTFGKQLESTLYKSATLKMIFSNNNLPAS